MEVLLCLSRWLDVDIFGDDDDNVSLLTCYQCAVGLLLKGSYLVFFVLVLIRKTQLPRDRRILVAPSF